jgi:hypothetical protein
MPGTLPAVNQGALVSALTGIGKLKVQIRGLGILLTNPRLINGACFNESQVLLCGLQFHETSGKIG